MSEITTNNIIADTWDITLWDNNLSIKIIIDDDEALKWMENRWKLKEIENEIEENQWKKIKIKCLSESLLTKIIDIVDDIISEIYTYFRDDKLEYVRIIKRYNFIY